jgi:CO/xanthine dehydrogenase FAD-binding subunit
VRPSFAYHSPLTLEEACRLLAAEPEAAVLAGGTDLMVHLGQPQRGRRPPAVINLKRIPDLATIEVGDRAIRLGALTTLSALIEHPVISREYPVLPFTARYMGSPAIRHLATVGGNLCNASPAADLAPVLLVLAAEAQIVGVSGERGLPLAEFFRGPGQTVLGPGELLTGVTFRPHAAADGWAIGYERLDVRRAMDIAIVGVGLALRRDGGRVQAARLALGAVAPTPLRVPAAEEALVGGLLSAEAIGRAAGLARAAAHPIGDVRATADYRREMVAALVRRGLARLAGPAPLVA